MIVQLKAGYAKVDITPAYSVPLSGYGNEEKRMHNCVLDPIYVVCVAIFDGKKTLLLYHMDLVGFPEENVEECKKRILEMYGIPGEYVLFNCTHTHSAPALDNPMDCIKAYNKELNDKVVALASLAIQDLTDATVMIGSGRIKGLNFVRRYLLSDGSYGGDNFGDFKNNTILDHETRVDDEMQAVRLVREGKKDVLLVNWQGHPHRTGGGTALNLSSDLIDPFRNTVEAEHDVLVAFFQGCGGNINHHSRFVPAEQRPGHVEVGKKLAEGLTPILEKMRPVKSGPIRASITTFTGQVDHSLDHRVSDANKVMEFFKTHSFPESAAFAKENGFNSVYHAMYTEIKAKLPKTQSNFVGAVSFGDVCIAWSPHELYDTTGMYLKATSPFEMTFVCAYSNGCLAYMPTIKAFAHGGYGCDTCSFPAGTTEKLTSLLLSEIVKVKG
jgi:hypothetical protein